MMYTEAAFSPPQHSSPWQECVANTPGHTVLQGPPFPADSLLSAQYNCGIGREFVQ